MMKDIFMDIHKKLFLAVGCGVLSLSVQGQASEIPVGERVAPPIGYLRFCLLNPADCRAPSDATESVHLNSWRWGELQAVQHMINRQVRPQADARLFSASADTWEYPRSGYGDCEDYALAKRQALIQGGWPGKALRLVTARTPEGEAHVVLAVSTTKGDLILDNLKDGIQSWQEMDYEWLTVQDRENPLRWVSAQPKEETAIASLMLDSSH